MENNIINISEGYKAVLLPKDARSIFCENTNSYGSKKLCYWDGFHSIYVDLKLSPDSRFELIGELNNLTEDQAREIVWETGIENGSDQTYLQDLKDIITGFGIQTENPLKEPKYDYPPAIREWEASERETKKIVIIKTKE